MKINNHSVLSSTGENKEIAELSDRLKSSSVSVIKEMMYLGAKAASAGKDIVSLGVGIPFYPAPKHVHDHVINQINSNFQIDKYTLLTGLPRLREIVAEQETDNLGFPVSPEEILITAGSMGGLFYSMMALLNKGDEVILPSPYFSSHAEQITLAQGKVISIPMIIEKNEEYRLDVNKIHKALNSKTKAIIINNPQNPTGALFKKKDLLKLAEILTGKKVYIIIDEVYDYLVYDNLEYFNIAKVKEIWPSVIRCCSLSKKYGMMGWRVGYLHTNKDLLMHILKIHDANIVCAPHISQEAAIAALSGPQTCVKEHVEWLNNNRLAIMRRLNRLTDLFSYIKPRGTYYVFPKYHIPLKSIEMAKKLLYEAGVVTVPGIGFGPEGEHHLRLSFGAPAKHINKAFDRIEEWWNKYLKTH